MIDEVAARRKPAVSNDYIFPRGISLFIGPPSHRVELEETQAGAISTLVVPGVK
jgi:stage V sporulation protein SpoVS